MQRQSGAREERIAQVRKIIDCVIITLYSELMPRNMLILSTEKLLYWDWPGKNRHDNLQEGSEAWQRLYDQNRFDIRLYEYAKQLFVAQAVLF